MRRCPARAFTLLVYYGLVRWNAAFVIGTLAEALQSSARAGSGALRLGRKVGAGADTCLLQVWHVLEILEGSPAQSAGKLAVKGSREMDVES